MDAETVYKVAQALDNTQRERLRQLLNTNVESIPITKKKKKKQLWDENELRERIIADFQRRAKEFKNNTLLTSSLR